MCAKISLSCLSDRRKTGIQLAEMIEQTGYKEMLALFSGMYWPPVYRELLT